MGGCLPIKRNTVIFHVTLKAWYILWFSMVFYGKNDNKYDVQWKGIVFKVIICGKIKVENIFCDF